MLKYVYELDSGRSKLFDLCKDASESKDLSDLYPDRVLAYREHVERWTGSQKALLAGSNQAATSR